MPGRLRYSLLSVVGGNCRHRLAPLRDRLNIWWKLQMLRRRRKQNPVARSVGYDCNASVGVQRTDGSVMRMLRPGDVWRRCPVMALLRSRLVAPFETDALVPVWGFAILRTDGSRVRFHTKDSRWWGGPP